MPNIGHEQRAIRRRYAELKMPVPGEDYSKGDYVTKLLEGKVPQLNSHTSNYQPDNLVKLTRELHSSITPDSPGELVPLYSLGGQTRRRKNNGYLEEQNY